MTPNFIESICFKNGAAQNLDLHQKRVDRTFAHFFPGKHPVQLDKVIPPIVHREKSKIRIIYSSELIDISYAPYSSRSVQSLKVMETEALDYNFKYEDRSAIERLLKKAGTDDILISKNGMITDGTYANLVFLRDGQWYTPDTCLLAGTKRELLLARGELKAASISTSNISGFEKVGFINAMLDIGDVALPTEKIIRK